MIRRRTRSRTVHSLPTAPSCNPYTKPKCNPNACKRGRQSLPQRTEHLTTPTFTWDIAKKDKQTIYNELGVKEMDPGVAVGGSCKIADKSWRNSKKQSRSLGTVVEGKGVLVSPDQFKPDQEHIHNGQACSCKKQLVLDSSDGPFYNLSDEVVMGIFRWLPMTTLGRCARVCKRWNHLVFDDTLWRHIDVSTKIFGPGMLGRVLQRGAVAAKLSRSSIQGSVFDYTASEPPTVTRTSSRTCKNAKHTAGSAARPGLHLQYIDLTASDTRPEQIVEILDRCPGNQVKKLSLESCALSDGVMTSVADHGGSLEELNLCMGTGLTGDALGNMLVCCTKLRSLNLSWTNLSRKDLASFVRCAPRSLEKLNLSGFRQLLTNDDVISLARTCLNMKELDLSDSTAIGFTAISAIIEHMTQLQHIALSRCYNIPRLAFVQLDSLKDLRALDIFGLLPEAEMLETIQDMLPRVQINIYPFSAIARPTTTTTMTTKRRNNIWEVVCHE